MFALGAEMTDHITPNSDPYWETLNPPIAVSSACSALSGWVQAFFWVAATLCTAIVLTSIATWTSFERYVSESGTRSDLQTWNDFDSMLDSATGFLFIIVVPLFILLVIWTYQIHKAANQLHAANRTWPRGWSIAAWFVPIASLILPKLVIGETERIVRAIRDSQQVTPDWRRTGATAGVGWCWWVSYVLMVIFLFCSAAATPGDTFFVDESQTRVSYVFTLVGSVFGTASAVCGAVYVRQMSHRIWMPRGLAE
jgi:hypothetical protein